MTCWYTKSQGLDGQCAWLKASPAASAAVPKVLLDFVEARIRGDVDASAACCTDDVCLASPNASEQFSGIDQMRSNVFHRAAPAPSRILVPLGPVDGDAGAGGGSTPSKGGGRVVTYAREFEVNKPAKVLSLRQELHLRYPPYGEAGEEPKICKIVMQVVKR